MKPKYTFLFFFLLVLFLNAQEKIAVNYNQEPLANVLVDIEEKFNIKFSFNSVLVNEQRITFFKELVSLQDIITAIESQTNLEFQKASERYYLIKRQTLLDLLSTQQLDEVVISEYITSGVNKKNDGSLVLTPKTLGILPGLTESDVLQSLQLLPGIQSPTETTSGLYVRGGTPDQNQILWDGIKMYNSGHFFGMISAFNPYITKDITFFSNGTSARYGNSISSVIDIASYNTIPEKMEGGLGFNMTHADLFLKIPVTQKLALVASARKSYTDAINTFTFQNLSSRVFQNTKISEGNKIYDDDNVTLTNDSFSFSDITLKAIFKPSKADEVVFSSLFTKNKLDYGFLIEEFEEVSKDILDIKNKGLSATWSHNYSNSFSHEIQAYYSDFELDYEGTNNYPNDLFNKTTKNNNILDKGLSIHTNWDINKENTLAIGYQLSSNEVDFSLGYDNNYFPDDIYEDINKKRNSTNTIYTDYQFEKTKKWLIYLGLRGDFVSLLKKFYLEPRLLTEIYLSKPIKAKIALERRHQNLSQILEFNTRDFGLENQVWALAQDNYVPLQRSNKLSIGFNFNDNGWNIDLDFYKIKTKGLSSLTRGFESTGANYSEGESRISGIDILLKKKINNYRTWLSYTTTKKDFNFSNINNSKPFSGNFHIAHQLYWSHSYKLNAFDLSLGWRFRTGIPYTKALGLQDDGYSILYDKINNERLPNYHRLDFSATYKFNFSKKETWKGKLGFSLLNIYNKKSILSKDYKVRLSTDPDTPYFLQETTKIALGITPNIVFRIEF